MKQIYSILLGAIFLVFVGCTDRSITDANNNSFEIVDLNNNKSTITVQISDAKYNNLILDSANKKPTIYSFFSTKCPECIKKIPHLIDLQNRYKEKINLIGVVVENRSQEEIKDFCDFYNINYRVVLGNGSYKLADAVGGVRMIPAVHLYDQDGKYATHFIGAMPQEMLESRINALLSKEEK